MNYANEVYKIAKCYETKRLILRTLQEKEASSLLIYFSKNKNFLEPWESDRAPLFYSSAYMKRWICKDNKEMLEGKLFRFWIFEKNNLHKIIGSIGIAGIEIDNFKKATLGYRLDRDLINQGYITESILKMVEISSDSMGIDRLEANVVVSNAASIRVLEKSGFSKEAYFRKNALIDGKWNDCYRYVWTRNYNEY